MTSLYIFFSIVLILANMMIKNTLYFSISCCLLLYLIFLAWHNLGKKSAVALLLVITLSFCYLPFFNKLYKVDETINLRQVAVRVLEVKTTTNSIRYLVSPTTGILKRYYYLYDTSEVIEIGDVLAITCELKPITTSENLGVFNAKRQLYSKKIFQQCSNPQMISATANNRQRLPISLRFKKQLRAHLLSYDEQVKPYLFAYILADRSFFQEEQTTFMLLGISHLFFQSPFFLRNTKKYLQRVMNIFRVTKEVGSYIYQMILLCYLATVGWYTSYSLTKGCLQLTITEQQKSRSKNRHTQQQKFTQFVILQVLFIAINPYIIFSVAFQFGSIISLFYYLYGPKLARISPRLLKVSIEKIAPFLLLLPLQLLMNSSVNLVSYLNQSIYLFIAPILFLGAIATAIYRPFTLVFSNIITLQEKVLTFLLTKQLMVAIPWFFLWQTLILLGLIILLLEDIIKKKWLKTTKVVLAIGVFVYFVQTLNGRLDSIHFLQLPDGEAIVIKHLNKVYMIDVGGSFKAKNNQYMVEQIFNPFFAKQQITAIDYLIITHDDADHIGNLSTLLTLLPISFIYLNQTSDSSVIMQQIIEEQLATQIIIVSEKIQLPSILILPSVIEQATNNNNSSLIIFGVFGGATWLFTGDLEKKGEQALLKKYPNLPKIDYLKIGHHGSRTSTSPDFLRKLQPDYAIIVVQTNNRFQHPHQETIDTLVNYQIKFWNTNEDGGQHYFFIDGLSIWKY